MGFFDKIFGSKAAATKFSGQKMTVLAPIDSTVIPLEQLPDETFATAILGPGCGLEPTGDMVYAPFDGKALSKGVFTAIKKSAGLSTDGKWCERRDSNPYAQGAGS